MMGVIDFLFHSKGMMPHGYCFLWNPVLLWVFVVSNITTALAYFSIPIALSVFVYLRKDVKFKRILLLFSLFIFACGIAPIICCYYLDALIWTDCDSGCIRGDYFSNNRDHAMATDSKSLTHTQPIQLVVSE